jgi:hypothetical protein
MQARPAFFARSHATQQLASRFLGDSVKPLPEGQYIKHFQYGLGVVLESDEDRTSIDFNEHGTKVFVTSILAVEPADGAPPPRKRVKRAKKKVT